MSPPAVLAIVVVAAVIVPLMVLRRRAYKCVVVYAPRTALLYRDGVFARQLPPGRHQWLDWRDRTRVFTLALTESPVGLPEITVISSDQFSFRVALAPTLRIVDARAYHESTLSPDANAYDVAVVHPALFAAVAAAAIAAVGRRPIAAAIAEPTTLADDIVDRVRDAVPGAEVVALLITAITLPPEVRKMFTDVERAKLEAAASVERARGEHAALRVLANAARLARDNPEIVQLRLLQSIEASKGATTVILGNGVLSSGGANLTVADEARVPE